ncbi:MAG: GAF domain-containing protein [Planctomycetota bacterium]|nr:MAG: GAF domain-containing protein [Planctomycetota bacterium]
MALRGERRGQCEGGECGAGEHPHVLRARRDRLPGGLPGSLNGRKGASPAPPPAAPQLTRASISAGPLPIVRSMTRAPEGISAPATSALAEMEQLVAVVQALSTARDVAAIQEIVRRAARALTGADGAAFVLRDGEQCYYADEDAIGPLWKGKRFPLTSCISGWSMLHRQPVAIVDIYQDARIPVDAYRPTFVKSLAMVPIRAREPIGAIGNYWSTQHAATERELRLLQALADSTSIALENVALLESQRAAKETALAASRLKDEFLTNVSHELRTPLNPILAWSELLVDDATLPQEAREAAQQIHENALVQLRHVDALLDVSLLIAGRCQLERARVELGAIVAAAVAAVRPAAQAKNVALEFAPCAEPVLALVDPQRVQQIAWNLVSNAVKFTPARGRVRIAVEADGAHARLRVSDDGIGIAPQFAPHVFERFRQADSSATRSAGGMGLGLAMVRHLVELHGGTVDAHSAGVGHGATFVVTLPLQPAARAAA